MSSNGLTYSKKCKDKNLKYVFCDFNNNYFLSDLVTIMTTMIQLNLNSDTFCGGRNHNQPKYAQLNVWQKLRGIQRVQETEMQ